MLSIIALGSNLGNSVENVQNAIADIAQIPQITLLRTSAFYYTEPWGYTDQPYFINAAISVETTLSSYELLEQLQALEQKYKRIRSIKNGPRTLDLDIITYGDEINDDPTLTLPHPFANVRTFVLFPVNDIEPDLVLPKFNATAAELLEHLPAGPLTEARRIKDLNMFQEYLAFMKHQDMLKAVSLKQELEHKCFDPNQYRLTSQKDEI